MMPDKPGPMELQAAEDLAAMADRLDELETLFGARARPVVRSVRAALLAGLAARDRGDAPAAVAAMQRAMAELVQLFGSVDAGEAAAMQELVGGFRQAMARGAHGDAGRIAADMRRRSGAVERTAPPADED